MPREKIVKQQKPVTSTHPAKSGATAQVEIQETIHKSKSRNKIMKAQINSIHAENDDLESLTSTIVPQDSISQVGTNTGIRSTQSNAGQSSKMSASVRSSLIKQQQAELRDLKDRQKLLEDHFLI